eukprot:TRINITY_DN22649_c0_g2_i1.p1 TRINITY_DN22649_c0_g2~~TRINITY_DN22649_c0_g2_i1.p1  ORF type:complete len:258 (-),score=10.98 TRINITY_DN22649_c0_g2_i1:262-1035(-)
MRLLFGLETVLFLWWWFTGGYMAGRNVSKRTLLTDLVVDLSTWTEERESVATRAIMEQQHFRFAFPSQTASSVQLQNCWAHTLWFLVRLHDWSHVNELHKILEFHTSRWLHCPRASSGELQTALCMLSAMVQQLRFKMMLSGGRRRRMLAARTARSVPVDVVVALQMEASQLSAEQTRLLRNWCVSQCNFVAGMGEEDIHFVYLIQLGPCSYIGRTARHRAQRHAPGPVQRWCEHTRDLFRHRTKDATTYLQRLCAA